MKLGRRLLVLGSVLVGCQWGNGGRVGPPVTIPPPDVITSEILSSPPLYSSVDVLFVVENSVGMLEEQLALIDGLDRLLPGLSMGEIRVAAVTADVAANPGGDFFTRPEDITDAQGRVVRAIPREFCEGVISNSQNGVLDSADPALKSFLDESPLIHDFAGRALGRFVDQDRDGVADNLVAPVFADAAACLLATGRSAAPSAGICQAAAALDDASLSGANAAFLREPGSALAVILVGNSDDCTLDAVEAGGELVCRTLPPEPLTGSMNCAMPSDTICGTEEYGSVEALEPVGRFAARLSALRPGGVFVATLAGPPGYVAPECATRSIEARCQSGTRGGAAPGNRYFEFVRLFPRHLDANDVSICASPAETSLELGVAVGRLLNATCLETSFKSVRSSIGLAAVTRIRLDISGAAGISRCEEITDIRGRSLMEPDPRLPGYCVQRAAGLDGPISMIASNPRCDSGDEISFLGFTPPPGSRVIVEYVVDIN